MNLNQKRIKVENNIHKEGNQANNEREYQPYHIIPRYNDHPRRAQSDKKKPLNHGLKEILKAPFKYSVNSEVDSFIMPKEMQLDDLYHISEDLDFDKQNAKKAIPVAHNQRLPIRPAKPGPNILLMMKRNAAFRDYKKKLYARKNLRSKFHQLYSQIRLQNLRSQAPFSSYQMFMQHIKGNQLEFEKYCDIAKIAPTVETRETLFADLQFKFHDDTIPNQVTDPVGYKMYIQSLFRIEKKQQIWQLGTVPYLRKYYQKIQLKLSANTKTPMRQINYKKPLIFIKKAQHFLPFGFPPRLGAYEGRNAFHLLPLQQQQELLNPIKKSKMRKIILKSPVQEKVVSEHTEEDWLLKMLKKFGAADEKPFEKNQLQMNEPDQLDQIRQLDRGDCVCGQCYYFMGWDNLDNPYWWNETFGCPFTGFMGEYFQIEKGPFFKTEGKQIKPFEFREAKITNRSNLLEARRFSEDNKPDVIYQEHFTPLQQQLFDQIVDISEEFEKLFQNLNEDEKIIISKRQQLYKKKHTITQKFLASIFDAEAPRNIQQYLFLYKLKIRVLDFNVSYIPKCPENYKKNNPIFKYPQFDEESGQIQYLKKIQHKKKPVQRGVFNINQQVNRVKEKHFNPLDLIHQQIEEDIQVAENK